MALVNFDGGYIADIGELLIAPLLERGLIFESEAEDGSTVYVVEDGDEPPTDETELLTLLSWEQEIEKIPADFTSDTPVRRLSDKQALDLLGYMLSCPSWPASLIEDVACVVRQTGRPSIKGATWDSH